MMSYGMGGYGLFGWLVLVIIVVVPFWRICTKAGYPGGLSLLIAIPLVNLVFLYFIAFSQWPSQSRSASAP
jgi:hypothetical protein